MLAAVIVLALLCLAALAALAYVLARPPDPARRSRPPDAAAAAALDGTPRPAGAYPDTRRLISIEILNPIELAGTRGRWAGIAGSLVPDLTRRVVYDRVLRILKQELDSQHVVADVRLHTLRPDPAGAADAGVEGAAAVDEQQHVDLDSLASDAGEER